MGVGPALEEQPRDHESGHCIRIEAAIAGNSMAHRALAFGLENFERYFESIAQPFEWKFTRADLNALIARMRSRYAETQHLKLAA